MLVPIQFHLLSFEGPDAYARAGGIATRVSGLAQALAETGESLYETADAAARGSVRSSFPMGLPLTSRRRPPGRRWQRSAPGCAGARSWARSHAGTPTSAGSWPWPRWQP